MAFFLESRSFRKTSKVMWLILRALFFGNNEGVGKKGILGQPPSDGNREMCMADSVTKIRIDKWLWAARFFKTRSLASRAVNGGKVHLNGARIKASKVVQNNDILHIVKGNLEFTVKVLGVLQYRRPASEARELYEETVDSADARKEKSEMMKSFHTGQKSPVKRPGKRDRRKIREFTRKD